MPYEAKNFEHLLGTPGFSDALLKNHFTLYEGYVANFNKLNDLLAAMEKEGKAGTPIDAELNRRFGWEWNGMRLHELYFGNMKNGGMPIGNGGLKQEILEEWGSMEMWEKDFRIMSAARGIGWVILYFDSEARRLFNVWVNEHDMGHLAGAAPLLVMDVFEHAFMLDYGLKRTDYIAAFFAAIDWSAAERRFGGGLPPHNS
ncbi:Fe-Mn family superoxide dismutase [bacterium]|nr:Fe-Mn family superoxide dismutase [bacterium]MCI0566506.1 Fe-Mn family superoxide dismutase [bacterium]MCI0680050.1 Fe-Mn family superoxide dismutase [bacterium]